MEYYLAGVADVDIFDGDELFSTAKTLMDSSISLNVSLEEIRGGQGAKLFGKYAHSSLMDITLNDVMFRLEYIAKNVGSDISVGGSALTNEEITIKTANTIEVANTPISFGNYGTIGWYKKPNDSTWTTGTFSGKSITVAGAAVGDVYCVKYPYSNDSMRQLVINANFIPATVHVVMRASLFEANINDTVGGKNTTKIGEVQIDIPRLMLSGAQDISMTMTGAAQTPLTGSALASGGTGSCSDDAIYGTIKELIDSANWVNDAWSLAITPADMELTTGETSDLEVYALIRGASPKKVNSADITFTSTTPGTATVSNSGVVTAVAAGTTLINAVLTSKPTVEAYANVTVA